MERVRAGEVEVRAGDADDLDAVYAELRGVAGITAEMIPAQAEPGDQGSVADLLTVACTSGAVTAFLQVIKALADSRGPAFRLRVRRGRQRVEITAQDPEKGLAALKDLLDGS
jgi:hypothetical protein